jgi:hypothetical protein
MVRQSYHADPAMIRLWYESHVRLVYRIAYFQSQCYRRANHDHTPQQSRYSTRL